MRSLDKKLLRDLWKMKGQALAIALVITSGVATYVMSISTLDSLRLTRSVYYQDYRFADVFGSLKRAPERMGARIKEIPGVDTIETRVVAGANIDIEGFPDPVTGRIISIPDQGRPLINALYLRSGRRPEPGRTGEILVNEAFAVAHGMAPGDRLRATIKGRRKTLTIVGIALSPEYIFQLGPGALFPDFKRFGVMWMGRSTLEAAYDMEGGFNDVVLTLEPGARSEEVIDRLDALLAPYGGAGAHGRDDQISHRFLNEEFRQLVNMATILPIVFLAVAAFLLNVVLGRIVSMQRDQVAILKAFGYSDLSIALHYLKLVFLISVLGVAGGVLLGAWLGGGLSNIYMRFYRFPFLVYELDPGVVVTASLVSAAAAFGGTLFSLRRAARLAPAEAMRPEPPVSYRETIVERAGLKRFISQPGRMIIRHIERRPVKSLLTVIGIALSCAILMMGTFFRDSIDYMVDVQFGLSQREDISVTFVEPTSRGALHELKAVEGVQLVEGFRSVPARLRFKHRTYRTSLQGVVNGAELHRLLDSGHEQIELPGAGVVLTDYLAGILGVEPGDTLTVEVLEGGRPTREVTVAGLVEQYIGVGAYMELDALNRLMREGGAVSGAHLAIDSRYKSEIYDKLKGMPRVAATVARTDAVSNFYETSAEQVFIFLFFIVILAGSIAFGVVYNSARIALSERGRELASLRVLGFTRAEISYILLGELALLTFAAIPLGFVLGRWLCAYILVTMQNDLYRIPLVLEPRTYAFSAAVVLVSSFVSALIVRERLDHLDLVEVLKTKE